MSEPAIVRYEQVQLLNDITFEPWGKTLLQLIRLLVVLDNERIQVFRATQLEFEKSSLLFFDYDPARIFPSSGDKEFFDFMNLLRLCGMTVAAR